MQTFQDFGFNKTLTSALDAINFSEPTPIQAQTIPLALAGHDILGSAQTGTGKTAAFALPVLQKLIENDTASALILTPTRELGKQIMDNIHQFLGKGSGIRTAFIIGGESYGKQMAQLRARPRIIVGTPGRINDHINRGSLDFDMTRYVVLDETDRMLDMGFTDQLERIFKQIPEDRQTLMFSATMPKNILDMSRKYLKSPKRIEVGGSNVIADNLVQDIMRVPEEQKYDELVIELAARYGTKIIFVKTKFATERMAKRLRADGYAAEAIHGDLKQAKRSRVIKDFRAQKFDILVATDVVARGLDVPHVEHVINYNLPQVAEDYIHRIGRTARAGAKGHALCFISPQEGRQWHAIMQLLDPDAKPDPRFAGFSGKNNKSKRRGGGKGYGKGQAKGQAKGQGKGKGHRPTDKTASHYSKTPSNNNPRNDNNANDSQTKKQAQTKAHNKPARGKATSRHTDDLNGANYAAAAAKPKKVKSSGPRRAKRGVNTGVKKFDPDQPLSRQPSKKHSGKPVRKHTNAKNKPNISKPGSRKFNNSNAPRPRKKA